MTELGYITENKWIELAEKLIEKYNEKHITKALIKYIKNNCPWLDGANRKRLKKEALSRHISRLFENRKWVGYEEFKNNYL
jgi:hypothetical protein